MFTGIVLDLGRLEARFPHNGGMDFLISTPVLAPSLKIGDSVACDGVCLTVTALEGPAFRVHAVPETLSKTSLGALPVGAALNLEPALSATALLGGHFVLGHVDGIARVISVRNLPDGSRLLRIRLPEDSARFCVEKGSIALSGVSLTLAKVDGPEMEIALIPHTLAVTTLGGAEPGDALNFETDMMGKYVEKFIGPFLDAWARTRSPRSGPGLS